MAQDLTEWNPDDLDIHNEIVQNAIQEQREIALTRYSKFKQGLTHEDAAHEALKPIRLAEYIAVMSQLVFLEDIEDLKNTSLN